MYLRSESRQSSPVDRTLDDMELVSFKYDGLGPQVPKFLTQGSTATATTYLYDGINAGCSFTSSGE